MLRIFAAVWLSVFLSLPARADITDLDNDSLKSLIEQGVPVIDVRRKDEWLATGVIEGSHLLTFFDKQGRYDAVKWLADLEKIASPDEPLVLICAHGVRSVNISKLLDRKLGYSAVHNVKKGINHWIAAGESTVAHKP